ncbi:hypothetical protein HDU98_000013 [Podochytrium sp. JEL0797]|nr:hypothetical protein HDU98_000013 [Podochytrium sp. JEL0797]
MEVEVENARRKPVAPLSPERGTQREITSGLVAPRCDAALPEPKACDFVVPESKLKTLKVRKAKLKEVSFSPNPEVSSRRRRDSELESASQIERDQHSPTDISPPKPVPIKRVIKSLKNPDILGQMKKREEERLERRNAVEQKRREREMAIQAEDQKIREKNHQLQQLQKASTHRVKSLMKHKAFIPWKVLVESHRQDVERANAFRAKWDVLAKVVLWRRALQVKRELVEEQAEQVYCKKLVKCKWETLCERFKVQKSRESEAVTINIHSVRTTFLRAWRLATKESTFTRLQLAREKELEADRLAQKLTPRRFLRKWRDIVVKMKDEKSREWRKEQLRGRIKELLVGSRFEEKLGREYAPIRRVYGVNLENIE